MKKILYTLALAMAFSGAFAQSGAKTNKKAKPAQTEAKAPVQKRLTNEEAARKYAETINPDELRAHLEIVASSEMGGRGTGTEGQKRAAEYLVENFRSLGLTGPVEGTENAFLQEFRLMERQWNEGQVEVNGKTYTLFKDFYVMGNAPYAERQQEQLVFAGYGIDDPAYSDYAGLDVQGKAVLVMAGEPAKKDGKWLLTNSEKASEWANNWRKKVDAASKHGASSVFIYNPEATEKEYQQTLQRLDHWLKKPTLNFFNEIEGEGVPAVFISPAMADAMIKTSAKKLKRFRKKVAKTGKPQNQMVQVENQIEVQMAPRLTPIETENVLALLPGTERPEEVVVISAHYDHIGTINGEIYYGADDDGSGTVSLLEIAEAFAQAKKDGYGPKRSLLFIAFTGEESGLLGSEYYANNSIYPMENTIANLNIDMIGRTDEKHGEHADYVYVIGADKLAPMLHEINERANEQYTNLDLDYTYNREDDPNRFYYRSDHYNFAKNDVPVIFYFSGVHKDYHRPSDTVDKIMFDKTATIVKLVFHTAWELVNMEERLELEKRK